LHASLDQGISFQCDFVRIENVVFNPPNMKELQMDGKLLGIIVLFVVFIIWLFSHLQTKQVVKETGEKLDELQLWNSLTEIQQITVQRTCEHAKSEEERAETFRQLVSVLAKQNQEDKEKEQT